jgi:hypothetical protein
LGYQNISYQKLLGFSFTFFPVAFPLEHSCCSGGNRSEGIGNSEWAFYFQSSN